MYRYTATILGFVMIVVSVQGAQLHKPRIVGPQESENYERALDSIGYTQLIWPRKELRDQGIPGDKLPQKYKDKVKRWLDKVVSPKLKPKSWETQSWIGMPQLDSYYNYIIGRWEHNNQLLYYETTWNVMVLTMDSTNTISKSPMQMTKAEVIDALQKLIVLSDQQVRQLKFMKHTKTLAGVPACYGHLKLPDLLKHSDSQNRKWWWSISYLITDHTIHAGFSIVNWHYPPASIKDRWADMSARSGAKKADSTQDHDGKQ